MHLVRLHARCGYRYSMMDDRVISRLTGGWRLTPPTSRRSRRAAREMTRRACIHAYACSIQRRDVRRHCHASSRSGAYGRWRHWHGVRSRGGANGVHRAHCCRRCESDGSVDLGPWSSVLGPWSVDSEPRREVGVERADARWAARHRHGAHGRTGVQDWRHACAER